MLATTPHYLPKWTANILLLISMLSLIQCQTSDRYNLEEKEDLFILANHAYQLHIQRTDFRFQFSTKQGEIIAPFHESSGLLIGNNKEDAEPIVSVDLIAQLEEQVQLRMESQGGIIVNLNIHLGPHTVKFDLQPEQEGAYYLLARTGSPGQAYGMGDHAATGTGKEDLILNDFIRDSLGGDNGRQRMISNFVIFPQKGFATVNMEPGSQKIVRMTEQEQAQGADRVSAMSSLYFFMGSPKEIYRAYLEARNREGYAVYQPKHEWFGVGWEAFGALAWNTNHETVRQNIDQYLSLGYPLSWMVVGSGFWPRGIGEFDAHGTPYGSTSEAAKTLQATTSFGMWDKGLYPDPQEFIDYFHKRGLIFNIGLRIGFIPGGPFTQEGLNGDFFLTDSTGQAKLFKVGFPRVPVYLLNSNQIEAVSWYVGLCRKWQDYGVDGFKEDLFHWPEDLQDDLIDPVNRALMDQGVYIMGRNNYLGSPADIHRFDDFNYNQSQDRGPINGLAYAFSGFPYPYPDIIGGTGLATGRFGEEPQEKLRIYLVRYAQYASLNPSMAFGFGPWNFDEETNRLCLAAAQLHHRLKPHIFSNAIKAFHTGFPYPMTPLPLAYPDDPHVYGLADTAHRNYQWLIGESLLAAPLYGDDYATATSRDIYLPEGTWIDYDGGQIYQGPQRLRDFPIPLDKTPLFVGGNGWVVEQEDGQVYGRIYPIQKQSTVEYWHSDGESTSDIQIDVQDWDKLTVINQRTGEEVACERHRHAWQFLLTPGDPYLIQ